MATGTTSCKVVVESSSRSILNLIFGFGSNKRNVSDLSDDIQNAVYRLMTDGEIKMNNNPIKLKPRILNSEVIDRRNVCGLQTASRA